MVELRVLILERLDEHAEPVAIRAAREVARHQADVRAGSLWGAGHIAVELKEHRDHFAQVLPPPEIHGEELGADELRMRREPACQRLAIGVEESGDARLVL